MVEEFQLATRQDFQKSVAMAWDEMKIRSGLARRWIFGGFQTICQGQTIRLLLKAIASFCDMPHLLTAIQNNLENAHAHRIQKKHIKNKSIH